MFFYLIVIVCISLAIFLKNLKLLLNLKRQEKGNFTRLITPILARDYKKQNPFIAAGLSNKYNKYQSVRYTFAPY